MKKEYKVIRNFVEVEVNEEYYQGISIDESAHSDELATFETLEEAKQELSKYSTSVTDYGKYTKVEEYCILEIGFENDEEVSWNYIEFSL